MKFLVSAILTLALVPAVLFIWAINSSLESPPNRLWQYSFWRFPYTEKAFIGIPPIKNFLGFSDIGDSKYDFLTNDFYKELIVEIDADKELSLPSETLDDIKKTIENTNNTKKMSLFLEGVTISSEVTYETLSKLKNNTDNLKTKTKSLHIILLPTQKIKYLGSDWGGVAYGSESLVIGIQNELNPELKRLFLRSKFSHEFGHLLGLRHTSDQNCVMKKHSYLFDFSDGQAEELNKYIGKIIESMRTESEYDYELISQKFFTYKYCKFELTKIEEVKYPPLVRTTPYPGSYYYTDEPQN
ncbi:MAG: hypothetical protein AAB443_03855 [Patescibacteria group bacterium]